MKQLAERYPALAETLPFTPLACLPTPLEPARRLAGRLDIAALDIKRDDLSGEIYGGNKVRKLEHLLADALARECDAVLSFGAVGSNHLLATAIYARQLGLACYGVVSDQPPTPKVAATLRYHALLGTCLVHAPDMAAIRQAERSLAEGHRGGPAGLYRIPWGGSSWLGATGFVNAALELATQVAAPPDRIYLANGTMGTAVGLAIGCRLLDWPTRIIGVRVSPLGSNTGEYGRRLFLETTSELHRRDPAFPALEDAFRNLDVRDGFLGDGYAVPTEAAREAIGLAAEEAGLDLDMTYTGKAMAALVSDARAGRLRNRRVLFWLTYNSRPYPAGLDRVSTAGLPAGLRRYL